jgi:dTDP-4-amino-4,6-dideoxygalactose transaminase
MMKITVTKTILPNIYVCKRQIVAILARGWDYNHGTKVSSLENRLNEFLGVLHLFVVIFGTTTLHNAIKSL